MLKSKIIKTYVVSLREYAKSVDLDQSKIITAMKRFRAPLIKSNKQPSNRQS